MNTPYVPIEEPLNPDNTRMWISHEYGDVGPPEVGDTVTVQVASDVDLYVAVEEISGSTIRGKVLAIGPKPKEEFRGWEYGSKVEFSEPFAKCIFRGG
jgi:hypothetical protein